MVGSVICFSIMDICVKWLDYYPIGQVLFLRFFIGFIPIFFIIPKDKILTITNASPEMTVSYNAIANNYHKMEEPRKDKQYQRETLTPEQNKKVNEIFDEFLHDEDEDPPTLH